ncbi:MAG: type II toxin-antitoxin system mRNA interferase toxin, RelE/StbE family [Patescibacteria group bacterium]|nr:type II toxin-antitoxin system mRNA interferase toxin, RelE/StbE family [Patescibacteria group bacterium]
MIEVGYKPSFIKQLNKLEKGLVDEAIEKIELFKDPKNHALLKVHKLHGKLSGLLSFSVDFKMRIVFEYVTKKKDEAVLLVIDDHDAYR